MYRILTEDKNRFTIEKLASMVFSGWTIYEATSAWKGKKEKSLIIELATDDYKPVDLLARKIKAYNGQDAIMIQKIKAQVELI